MKLRSKQKSEVHKTKLLEDNLMITRGRRVGNVLNMRWAVRRAPVVMSTGHRTEVSNHNIVHLKRISYCMLSEWKLIKNLKKILGGVEYLEVGGEICPVERKYKVDGRELSQLK